LNQCLIFLERSFSIFASAGCNRCFSVVHHRLWLLLNSTHPNFFFAMIPKKEIFALASDIWRNHSSEELSVGSRLGAAIGKRMFSAATSKIVPNDRKLKLACENNMTTNILHTSLKQILFLTKPTSIKNQQNFSMSTNFLSKNRKRMDPNTLDDLCLLNFFFPLLSRSN